MNTNYFHFSLKIIINFLKIFTILLFLKKINFNFFYLTIYAKKKKSKWENEKCEWAAGLPISFSFLIF